MIVAGQLLLETTSKRCRLVPGYLRLHDGHISDVIEGQIPRQADFGGDDWLIAPGFIDAHVHLPQFDIIGAHGMPLLSWLNQVTFPAEKRWEDVDYATSMTKRVVEQLVSHGTTTFCAYATVHHESANAALRYARDYGMRGVIGHVLMNRQSPDYLCRETGELIDQTSRLLSAFPPGQRMAAAVTPRFAIACTGDLLGAAGKLAAQHDAIVQTHLAETADECELVSRLFGGDSYVEVYRKAGLISARSILGHGIHLDANDRAALAAAGASVAHCPTANSFLRSGTMHRKALVEDGVRVAIGSDIGAGYERSMVRVGRAMIESASSIGDVYPSAAEAWHGITAGNADHLGFRDAGRLQVDAPADLVMVKPDIAWQTGAVDPLSMLMFAWDDRWIRTVMLRGQSVVLR